MKSDMMHPKRSVKPSGPLFRFSWALNFDPSRSCFRTASQIAGLGSCLEGSGVPAFLWKSKKLQRVLPFFLILQESNGALFFHDSLQYSTPVRAPQIVISKSHRSCPVSAPLHQKPTRNHPQLENF
jgi:hypothetical protein